MGLVYSYIRFSTLKQMEGNSTTRQMAYARQYAETNGLVLDESLTMHDKGLSAFTGKHLKGAFGAFKAAIEAGKVPAGSTLVVESLDRLSRQTPRIAQQQLTEIINAGITVVTMIDNKVYSQETLDKDPMALIYSVLDQTRAHNESKFKSERVRGAFRDLCKAWQEGTYRGKIRTGNDPMWVRWEGGRYHIIPERAIGIRAAVRMFMDGYGGNVIAKRLLADGISPTTSNISARTIYNIISNPALMGVKRVKVDGEDFDLADYYPRVLNESEWAAMQAVVGKKQGRGRRGAQSDIPHVITGLGVAVCGYCGRAMGGQNMLTRRRPGAKLTDGYRRLMCLSMNSGNPCKYAQVGSVAPIERMLMEFCSDIMNLRDLYGADPSTPMRTLLAQQRAELVKVEKQYERLITVILESDSPPATLARKSKDLEAQKLKLVQDIAHTEHMVSKASRTNVDSIAEQWAALGQGVNDLDYDARLKARQLVADTFEHIVIYSEGWMPKQNTGVIDIQLISKGGTQRWVSIDRRCGRWKVVDDKATSAEEGPQRRKVGGVLRKHLQAA